MRDATLPLIEPHHPTTFQSRGVAAPFTTPLLAGARVRRSAHMAVELVMANPSGGRGIYVLPWSGVREFCHPTLLDTILFRRFANLATIDPGHIRGAVLAVALEGHAGQEALASAHAAVAHDRARRGAAHSLLLTNLLRQLDPSALKDQPAAQHIAYLEQRATAALQRIAASIGRPAAELVLAVAAIGEVFAPVGIAADDRDARIPRLLIRLAEAYADLLSWLDSDAGNDIDGLGLDITVAFRAAYNSGAAVLAVTRAMVKDPIALLRRWTHDEAGVRALAARCDWLLDGWERVAALWLSAPRSRRTVLLEIAALIPMLPREVLTWKDVALPAEAIDQVLHVISYEDTWRIGAAAFPLIERNEKLIAMSALAS